MRAARSVAILDGASSVLPYDFQLVQALAAGGTTVGFFGSRTAYNGALLDAMRAMPNVAVDAAAISGTVAPSRWRGALAYAALLWRVRSQRAQWELVNLQFPVLWPLEAWLLRPLRDRLVLTVHNAVPHGHAGRTHGPTERLARLAMRLVFVSEATRDDFLARYGEAFRPKATLLPHGLLPAAPGMPPQAPRVPAPPRALVFWSNVKPYKGIELFEALAASPAVRDRGLALRIVGRWDGLGDLKARLAGQGVEIVDRYLDPGELLRLFATDSVFLLPYQRATQSGALYTLLHHGACFLTSDSGDLGAFMRRFGLAGLLIDTTADSVLRALDHLAAHRADTQAALARAQAAMAWPHLLADHPAAYASRPDAG